VRFLRRLAVRWPGVQSARDNHVLARIFAKYSSIKNIFTGTLSNGAFLIWLLTTLQRFKHVATLPCNSSLMACLYQYTSTISSVLVFSSKI